MAVGILCSKTIDSNAISDIFKNTSALNPYICSSTHDLLQNISKGTIESTVIGVSRFTYEDLDLINKIRKRLTDIPMIILSKKMEQDLASLVESLERLATLRYPEELKDISGVMNKIINQEEHHTRKHVRYETDIECQAQWGVGPWVRTSICNISKGGALLYVDGSGFRVGAHLKVLITESGNSEGKIVPAEVRWIESEGASEDDTTTLMGVVFLKAL